MPENAKEANNKIIKEKMEKYFKVTEKALSEVRKHIIKENEKYAEEVIKMAENYVSDAHHFYEKGDWVDAFGALNYAHGWLDCGVRLDVFDVADDKLFTVK